MDKQQRSEKTIGKTGQQALNGSQVNKQKWYANNPNYPILDVNDVDDDNAPGLDKKLVDALNTALFQWLWNRAIVATKFLATGGNAFVFSCHIDVTKLNQEMANHQGPAKCKHSDLTHTSTVAMKVMTSIGNSRSSFLKKCEDEFYWSKRMEQEGYGLPVFCYASFPLVGRKNIKHPKRRYKDEDVIYFLLFMAEMRGSLSHFIKKVPLSSNSNARSAMFGAMITLAKASLKHRYVFSDLKPGNFLVGTKNNNSSPIWRVTVLSDFDPGFLFMAKSSQEAVLLNFTFLIATLANSLFSLGEFDRADNFITLIPQPVLLFMSDLCNYYALSPKTSTFFASCLKSFVATNHYTKLCSHLDWHKAIQQKTSTHIAKLYLLELRRALNDKLGKVPPQRCVRGWINSFADEVFLGIKPNQINNNRKKYEDYGIVDFSLRYAIDPGAKQSTVPSISGCN